ncbi:MAG: tetratricopeptide repeat protein [Planctomycetaceae bacterium]|nr:tetratricopeptide repeat protein [Planctomycetaceae bacterium]
MSTIYPVLPRFLSTLILAFCAVRTTSGSDSWTSKNVLTRRANVAFQTESGQGGTLKDFVYKVRECTGDKLLVKDIDGAQGWADRTDFVEESEALEVFTQQLRSEPSALAYHRRALAWYRKRDFDIALQDLEAAIKLDSKAAYAHQLKGLIHGEKMEYYDALSSLNLAIRLAPYNATAYRDRGIILVDMGSEKEARLSFSQAIRVLPTFAEAYLHRAEALESWQFGDEAMDRKIAGLSDAIRIDPSYAEAYLNRGTAFSKRSDGDLQALADFDQAIKLRPDFTLAHYNRGQIYRRLDKYDRAAAAFGEAIRCAPTWAEAYWRRAFCYEEQGQWAKSLDDLNAALRINPREASYYNSRAGVHRALGNLAEAAADAAEYDRLTSPKSNQRREPVPYLSLAGESIRKGDYDEAIEIMTKYLNHTAPNSGGVIDPGEGHQLRGEAYLGKREFYRAIYDFTRAIPFEDPQSIRCRAIAFRHAGQTESAIADLSALLHLDPRDATALFDRASLYFSAKRHAWAIDDLEKALGLRPDWKEAIALLEKVRVRRSAEGDDPSTPALRLNHATKSFDVVYAVTLPHRAYLLNSTVTGARECYLTGPTGRLCETGRPAVFLRPGSVLRGDRIGGPTDRYYRYSEEKTWKRSEPPEIYYFQEDIAGGDKYTELPPLTDD